MLHFLIIVEIKTNIFYIFRGFAKKTLLKTARRAGFKQKASSKRQKYVLPNVANNADYKYMTSPGRMNIPFSDVDNLSGKKFALFMYFYLDFFSFYLIIN